jgi:transcriptional regulator with PAS, ATPase and Fis domain
MRIQPFIQAYVLAISSILETEVTVVDEHLTRVGGVGPYADQSGRQIGHAAFFRQILESGKPGLIHDVRASTACAACALREDCPELADLAYPIFLEGRVAGLISVVAFREHERERLLRDRSKLEEFLKYMSALLESKILTERSRASLERQIREAVSTGNSADNTLFIGNDPQILDILKLTEKISRSESTVLISGESGTGKDMLAKMIHANSPRSGRLMITVNCGAIPDSLVESELFGYEEGAFTGARRHGRTGRFELADNSTLFLDEVSEMPLPAQTKLLRVLQERAVERLGSNAPIPVNVRVICATNRNLEDMVAQGRFREDLYYRLKVIPITMPPLRQRPGDIAPLCRHFIARYNRMLKKSIQGLDPGAQRLFAGYDWPGNVRELRNIIEYLANTLEGESIRAEDLPEQFFVRAKNAACARTLDEMMDEYERHLFARLLKKRPAASDRSDLARQLGISRATLYRKLAAHKLL